MTPRQRLRRAQRRLVGAVALAALLWAATLAMIVIVLAVGADKVLTLAPLARVAIIPLAALAALVAAAVVLWRGRAARSIERVALWVEEREPGLRYALVTAIDPVIAPVATHPDLHAIASRADVDGIVRHAWHRTLARAVVFFVALAAMIFVLQPRDLLHGARLALGHRIGEGPPAPMANRLAGFSARVVPPPYSRFPARTLREPANIAALIGSKITLDGDGPPDGITATLDSAQLGARAGARGWSVGVTMPRSPAVLALHDRAYKMLLTLEPRVDSAPAVRLLLPLHDTTYKTVPKEKIQIEAALTDDIGLAYGYVEYMLSSGAEESFDTKLLEGTRVSIGNARSATLRATIDLDTMKLAPGSVLHIRVISYDFNDVTGPGRGVSETRTLKIAEPIDSTSINAAPPSPIDSMWISQRLLNMNTDTLIRTKRKYSRDDFVHKSSGYSNVQEDIRKRALAVVALLEDSGVGSSFPTETSKKLRHAADLMWTAREALGVALPDSAMPIMKEILKILDEIRLANRYYLRGVLKPVPVDIGRIRLTGKDSANVRARTPRPQLRDQNRALVARLDVAAVLSRSAPAAAADSLVYIRVAALTSAPTVAAALQNAIDLLRKGVLADSALTRARRALEPPTRLLTGPLEWGGVLP